MPVYIGKSGDLVGVTDASLTERQQNIGLLSTQLVYSIKFTLSHAVLEQSSPN